MNILLFSPIPSHPHYHGHRKRIYNLTKYLKQMGHEIHFVYFNEDPLFQCDCAAMDREWTTFTLIKKQNHYVPKHGNYEFDEWYQDDIHKKVNRVIELFDIDILWMNYTWQSKLFEYIPSHILKVIDTHDKFTDRYKLLGANGNTGYQWFSCSKKDEGKYLDRADAIASIQSKEAQFFKTITQTPIHVVGHIEQSHFFEKTNTNLRRIGFLGSHNPMNAKGINDFLQTFYRHSHYANKIEIIVAGTVCNAVTAKHDNLTVLGQIDDLERFYNSVDLIVNPLCFGTGLKIKSMEALAYGIPIVSTKVGFEGIDSNSPYHQAENMLQMTALIEELFETPARLKELAQTSQNIFKIDAGKVAHNIDVILSKAKIKGVKKRNVSSLKDTKKVLQDYRDEMQIQWVELVISEQKKLLELKEAHILKQSNWIKKQEKIIEEKTLRLDKLNFGLHELMNIRFFAHPIKKLKGYKKLIKIYQELL